MQAAFAIAAPGVTPEDAVMFSALFERIRKGEKKDKHEEAHRPCSNIVMFKRVRASGQLKTPEAKQMVEEIIEQEAMQIGIYLAKQIIAGKYSAAVVVGEGLENLEAGRDFKPSGGRKKSAKQIALAIRARLAIDILKDSGTAEPSQTEVLSLLNKTFKEKATKHELARVFDERGWRKETSDARASDTPAGIRRTKAT